MSVDGIIPTDVDCFPGPDVINFTCRLEFHGNIVPWLEWTQYGDAQPIYPTKSDHDLVKTLTIGNITDDISDVVTSTNILQVTTNMSEHFFNCSITFTFKEVFLRSKDNLPRWRSPSFHILCKLDFAIIINSHISCTWHNR